MSVIPEMKHNAEESKEVQMGTNHNWWRDVLFLLLGGLLSWLGNYYYYYSKTQREAEASKNQEIAQYVVAAMLPQHPVKDSYELRQRIDQYLSALSRTKADHRGTPVYRGDGSIGVDWSINIAENLRTPTPEDKLKMNFFKSPLWTSLSVVVTAVITAWITTWITQRIISRREKQ